MELRLSFPDPHHVSVSLGQQRHPPARFINPCTPRHLEELAWYLEHYAEHSLGDPDDVEAARIAKQLPVWGKALYAAAFEREATDRLIDRFLSSTASSRVLTISACDTEILSLPWELLHEGGPAGTFLIDKHINIRRDIDGSAQELAPRKRSHQGSFHVLFVVSRPLSMPLLDPRADSMAVLDAIETHAAHRCTWEFLHPPTLHALAERLDNATLPRVDVIHFDGHGAFGLARSSAQQIAASESGAGHLFFETPDRQPDPVSAQSLARSLAPSDVSLIVLSACQGATPGPKGAALGSVAGHLVEAAAPAVVAMTYGVLACTTRALFREFYRRLACGSAIGAALNAARLSVREDPRKYEVLRLDERLAATRRQWLVLRDWFVPALYQRGEDLPLIREGACAQPVHRARSNVPRRPAAGFFGRRQELFDIERWFAGPIRCISIVGMTGQGKTALAQEAARWLTRISIFQAAVFVEYRGRQVQGAVSLAIAKISEVLGQRLSAPSDVRVALTQTRTLVILARTEALAHTALSELLLEADSWSKCGKSCVLLTTCDRRLSGFWKAGNAIGAASRHREIRLRSLGGPAYPDDALEWYAELSRLAPSPSRVPHPTREKLIELFDQVQFLPLAIQLIAHELRTRSPEVLADRLRVNFKKGTRCSNLTEQGLAALAAPVAVVLEKLDPRTRRLVSRLGVMRTGGFEENVLVTTALSEGNRKQRQRLRDTLAALTRNDAEALRSNPDLGLVHKGMLTSAERRRWAGTLRRDLAQVPRGGRLDWPGIRALLEATGLLQVETFADLDDPYLRFHPALAPILWARLNRAERRQLTRAHWHCYSRLAERLYEMDPMYPREVRRIVQLELANLLQAVSAAFGARFRHAVEFAVSLARPLRQLGLYRQALQLEARAREHVGSEVSRGWYLLESEHATELMRKGDICRAGAAFKRILDRIGAEAIYDRAATLYRLGVCMSFLGRLDLALSCQKQSLLTCGRALSSRPVRALVCRVSCEVGELLTEKGCYSEARRAYARAFDLAGAIYDIAFQLMVMKSLGRLALREKLWAPAVEAQRIVLALSQALPDVAAEMHAWRDLGELFCRRRQWKRAEYHYRESVRLAEQTGDITIAAYGCRQIARTCIRRRRFNLAEQWYRRAIAGGHAVRNYGFVSDTLQELALKLYGRRTRLQGARQLALEALEAEQLRGQQEREIWRVHDVLKKIARVRARRTRCQTTRQTFVSEVQHQCRLARAAKRADARTWAELKSVGPFVVSIVAGCLLPRFRKIVRKRLRYCRNQNVATALEKILVGQRDVTKLCMRLDATESMIVEVTLAALEKPQLVLELLPLKDGDLDAKQICRSWLYGI